MGINNNPSQPPYLIPGLPSGLGNSQIVGTDATGNLAAFSTVSVGNGGTGLSSLTTGRIPFGAGTAAFGNTSSLFWDTANSRLGVGTSAPIATLHVASGAGATLAQIVVGFGGSANYYDADGHFFRNAAASTVVSINSTGVIIASALTVSSGTVGTYSGITTNFTGANNYYDATNHIIRNSSRVEVFRITNAGNMYPPAGATTMTNGFFYMPAAAGAPTGVPTALTGTVPFYYDTTNNQFYVYNGAWKKVALA